MGGIVASSPAATGREKTVNKLALRSTICAQIDAIRRAGPQSVKSGAELLNPTAHNSCMDLTLNPNPAVRAPEVLTPLRVPNPRDPESLRRWLTTVGGAPAEALAQLDAWLLALRASPVPADLTLELLEAWRPVHVAAADTLAKSMGQLIFPMPLETWRVMTRLLQSLERAQAAFRDVYVQLTEVSGAATHMVIPGTAHALRSVTPLARAMDYAARSLRLRMTARIHIPEDDWGKFAVMAQHLRISSFLDTALPGTPVLVKDNTARGLFVYPLLLRLADTYGLRSDRMIQVDRMARRWAGKVGFRIDEDGRLHDNPHGPTVVINDRVSVRLDTHRLERRLREVIEGQTPIATGVVGSGVRTQRSGTDPVAAAEMMPLWCGRALPKRWVPSDHGAVGMRFGLPPPAQTSAEPATDIALNPGAASMAYVYGRFEHNTIMRMVLGNNGEAKVDPVAQYLDQGDGGTWVLSSGSDAWVERFSAQSLGLGQIVAMRSIKRPDLPFRLGQLAAMEQITPAHGDNLRKQTLRIKLWPSDARLVGLRLADESFFTDCFELQNDPVLGPTLITAPARVRSASMAALRLPEDDLRIELGEVVERGPGWQRMKYRLIGN